MSRVASQIKAVKGHQYRSNSVLFNSLFRVSKDSLSLEGVGRDVQYRIGIQLGADCWISEIEGHVDKDHLQRRIEHTKNMVIEAIFGEFRENLLMIQRHLFDRDIEGALAETEKLKIKMFETDSFE